MKIKSSVEHTINCNLAKMTADDSLAYRQLSMDALATPDDQKLHIQLFPHSPSGSAQAPLPFVFAPVELFLSPGVVYSIGRKIDKVKTSKTISRDDRASNNVLVDAEQPCINFRSKVVSRAHAELWVGKDLQVYFRDIGSSSGSFLNHLRLSPSGKESRPYPLAPEDVIQLGVDYQGRQEGLYY